MRRSWRTALAAAIPSLRRRDERLAQQADEIAQLRKEMRGGVERQERQARQAERRVPSFRQQYRDLTRQAQRAKVLDREAWHPYRQLKCKLRNYRLVESHGVEVPKVYAVWSTPEEIDVTALPERFVLKSDFGSNGRGVLLLRRVGEDQFETLAGSEPMGIEQIVDYFVRQRGARKVAPPYFAEELLVAPRGGLLPVDVKIYAFYGAIAQILLRRVNERGETAYKFLGADGQDLGAVSADFALDATIEAPDNLDEMREVAAHLSRALGVPGCRIDLYNTTRGIIAGELTLTPGGPQEYDAEHDAAMGGAWRDAVLRRDLDLIRGRPFGILHGSAPNRNRYPVGHRSRRDDPGAWRVTSAACEEWCQTSSTRRADVGDVSGDSAATMSASRVNPPVL